MVEKSEARPGGSEKVTGSRMVEEVISISSVRGLIEGCIRDIFLRANKISFGYFFDLIRSPSQAN